MDYRRIGLAAVSAASVLPASAAVVMESYNFTVAAPHGDLPDNGSSSIYSQVISSSQITGLTEVKVGLHLVGDPVGGGWAGDIFASLNMDFGARTAVLLNQVGAGAGNPLGFGYDGWDVTFQDGAANGDIHLGQPVGPVTVLGGLWQPDGRLSPGDSARTKTLSVFDGGSGNATWSLTLADLNSAGTMTLKDWSLTFTGFAPVPEPAHAALLAGLGLVAFALGRRKSDKTRSATTSAVSPVSARSGSASHLNP